MSCPSLDVLLQSDEDMVVGVVTQPDRPKGRRRRVMPCDVKAHLGDRNVPVLTPENVNTPDSVAALTALAPELIVVVAYGQILRQSILEWPRYGCINIHTSLLPKYRGAAPIQWAIANGDKQTGVTAMYMNQGMDAGDIIAQRSVPIPPEADAGQMHTRLAQEGAILLARVVADIRRGRMQRTPQDEQQVTFAPKLTKADGHIDWSHSAEQIANRVRAFNPWPGAYCERFGAERTGKVKILKARAEDAAGQPGQVIEVSECGPLVAAQRGALRVLQVQPAGRRSMSGAEYLHGYEVSVGDMLE